MARFFMAATNLAGGRAIIRGRDAEHIRVLRMRPGEEVTICDGDGTDYIGSILRVGEDEAEVEILRSEPTAAEYSGLLEYDQYTKPREYEGMEVPEVLYNGNHKLIHLWQYENSLRCLG